MHHYLKCDISLITVPILKCEHCPKQFVRQYDWKKHQNCHNTDKSFKCPFCDFSAADNFNLTQHVKRHNNRKPFECSECKFHRFETKDELYEHQIECLATDRPYKCEVCGRKYKRECDLRHHEKVHSNVKEYGCDICGKRFKQSSQLWQHRRFHDETPRFQCNFCDYRAHFKFTIRRHAQAKHKTEFANKLPVNYFFLVNK